jgi:4-hydroxybenzoate polyprenyltransferase
MRIPNAFTAVADVSAGFLAAGGWVGDSPRLAWLALASACLYTGGIVLNDICDLELDRRERAGRPLPSGRIALGRARGLAALLLGGGLAVSGLVTTGSLITAALLVVLIILYDGWAKRSAVLGPVCMGSCRFVNVLLGSTGVSGEHPAQWMPALLVAGLVVSATLLSRDEVRGGRRNGVLGASVGLLAIVALAGAWIRTDGVDAWGLAFLAGFLVFTAPALARAWQSPSPVAIQRGVKRLVLGIIPLDAVVAAGAAGPMAGCLVLGLLIPCLGLARWIYVT